MTKSLMLVGSFGFVREFEVEAGGEVERLGGGGGEEGRGG